MDTAAIALIVALIVTMACGLEITWSLGLACIVAVLLDPNLTSVSYTHLTLPTILLV